MSAEEVYNQASIDEPGIVDGHDLRPWRTYRVPEPTAVQLEYCVYLAQLLGCSNYIEALDMVCAEFLSEHNLVSCMGQYAQERSQSSRFINTGFAHIDDGWRCLLCETSRNLDPHHIVPLGAVGGPEELALREMFPGQGVEHVTNIATLCRRCHDRVQPEWRKWVTRLRELKLERKEETRRNGWIFTKKSLQGGKK